MYGRAGSELNEKAYGFNEEIRPEIHSGTRRHDAPCPAESSRRCTQKDSHTRRSENCTSSNVLTDTGKILGDAGIGGDKKGKLSMNSVNEKH